MFSSRFEAILCRGALLSSTGRFCTETNVCLGSVTLRIAITPPGDPPMVLLHGVTRRWQSFLPVVGDLATRHQLWCVDLRGHGGSSRASAYRTVDYVPDIVTLLREHIRQPAVVYGHSLGSMVAAGVAAEAPELVRALVLEDPPFETMGSRIRQTRLHSYFTGVAGILRSGATPLELARDLGEVRMVDPATNSVQRLSDVRDPVFLKFTGQSLAQLDPRVLEPIVAGDWLRGYDMHELIPRIAAPTLLLRADPAVGGMLTEDDARWCREHLRDGTLLDYPGVPHLIHQARPKELATHVLGFVASLDQ
jgi:pimeloyl-ACP methyl ester carboxylesterase